MENSSQNERTNYSMLKNIFKEQKLISIYIAAKAHICKPLPMWGVGGAAISPLRARVAYDKNFIMLRLPKWWQEVVQIDWWPFSAWKGLVTHSYWILGSSAGRDNWVSGCQFGWLGLWTLLYFILLCFSIYNANCRLIVNNSARSCILLVKRERLLYIWVEWDCEGLIDLIGLAEQIFWIHGIFYSCKGLFIYLL